VSKAGVCLLCQQTADFFVFVNKQLTFCFCKQTAAAADQVVKPVKKKVNQKNQN
jgi:hypothetical protein